MGICDLLICDLGRLKNHEGCEGARITKKKQTISAFAFVTFALFVHFVINP